MSSFQLLPLPRLGPIDDRPALAPCESMPVRVYRFDRLNLAATAGQSIPLVLRYMLSVYHPGIQVQLVHCDGHRRKRKSHRHSGAVSTGNTGTSSPALLLNADIACSQNTASKDRVPRAPPYCTRPIVRCTCGDAAIKHRRRIQLMYLPGAVRRGRAGPVTVTASH